MSKKQKGIIIIPAYNESACIRQTVEDIIETDTGFDYIVINDCSNDETGKILDEHRFNHIDLPINLGIGGAVQTGYKYALENGYTYAVQVDGDGQHDTKYLKDMMRMMKTEHADMVIGSRFIENQGFQSSAMRRTGIRYFTWLIKRLTKVTITDPTSGFRLADRKIIENFAKNYPRDYPEPESIINVIENDCKVVECPVMMRERQGGTSSINLKKSVYYMIKVTLAIFVENIRKH